MMLLARSCCTMPMIMFAITTGRKVRFFHEPTAINRMLSSRKMALKYVNTFDAMMAGTLLPAFVVETFALPRAASSWASFSLRPSICTTCS